MMQLLDTILIGNGVVAFGLFVVALFLVAKYTR